MRAEAPHRRQSFGLVVFLCELLVIATGGPGELYRDSVYPRHCFGSLGLALEAGLEAVNLTESQFGIGTSRDDFPWNLSGTYVQAMPYIFSLDRADGAQLPRRLLPDDAGARVERLPQGLSVAVPCDPHARLRLEPRSTSPSSARRRPDGRCSWTSTATAGGPRRRRFDLDRLDADVRAYLENAGALLEKPIERLRKMNPLSIELYRRYKYDITHDPLEFAVNNQHMNGGLAVDVWGETSLKGCYAVGEAAGTHGVTRPGGAALNAGQVFGTRCAEHIAARRRLAASRPEQD